MTVTFCLRVLNDLLSLFLHCLRLDALAFESPVKG